MTLLGALDAREQLKLAVDSTVRSLRRREVLFHPGDQADCICIVLDGKMKISRVSESGKEVILGIMGPGESLGLEIILAEPCTRTLAMALEPSRILRVSREKFQSLVLAKPELLLTLLRITNEQLWNSRENLSRLVFMDVKGRLAALLLELSESGEKSQGCRSLETRITHQDLANLIGSTRETTTATLNQLRREKLIRFEQRNIVISRPGGLETLAAS
ncbi:MAG: Crp/Fnr family transcriptional regulator [Candidatus Krumholzibacteria bacterium]|nr:Crp/Fnr family transcriptional regulator [Candidatus Krumholzibacteria bacterium]MDP6668286.1 Crp/Fnr family transcriptional regulator [Candidatus Krumholzibacteria bacterium]MDP6797053.1 Crp/Fnr family transcriptional regulator [Candidatus Krumholzibacteria bacterium]MDP7022090.1 Crp/Fnr family transcriptional regulator [Candidatus Krumholzibacteria bacterium]